ncbi:hypothetical protein A3F38_00595 [Candidatus Saccharibacteria bacterium RIFCSPHIGHO2_12_FULL_48_21]|nr:MAG: hypothetical protein A3F38_00595 [Candidatus Saccharibacteria bacterium RIFCSPHIGHO2_12_FULL_48_21]
MSTGYKQVEIQVTVKIEVSETDGKVGSVEHPTLDECQRVYDAMMTREALKGPKGKPGKPKGALALAMEQIPDAVFIPAWQKADSLTDASNSFPTLATFELAHRKQYVSLRACLLRKAGVEIKAFPRGLASLKRADKPFGEAGAVQA